MPFGLENKALGLIKEVLMSNPKIDRAVIYGSRAKGDYQPYSDIDIAIFGPLEWNEAGRLHSVLDELPLPYKFDVLHYETLNHAGLKDHIDRVGKDIYVREKEKA